VRLTRAPSCNAPLGTLLRSRRAGERVDRIAFNPNYGEQGLASPAEWGALAALVRHGLDVLADAPVGRRARLLERLRLTEAADRCVST
jgi:hypothetical protein